VTFAELAQSGGVEFDRLLLGLSAEFRKVDRAAALEALDELSRPLFGIGEQPARQAGERIAATLWHDAGLRPTSAGIDAFLLDRVLQLRRGHPILLAAVYVEAARRAGVSLRVLSSPRAWFAGLVDDAEVILIDPAPSVRGARSHGQLLLRGHCPHELAYLILGELMGRLCAEGRTPGARRAAELRLLLPLEERLLARARQELRELF
jgi:regulator of sirC expression with transglutaminase-like and TPR domain